MTPAPRVALAALLLVASSPLARAQDQPRWQTDGLASFDNVWQTIADTFYDPAFGGIDWPAVRLELRPRAERATSADEIRRVITEMLGRLGRSHFVLLSSADIDDAGPIGEATVPIDVRVTLEGLLITRVQRDSPAARAGVFPGQRLLAIDGVDTANWMVSGSDVAARQRAQTFWRRARRALHGSIGTVASLTMTSSAGPRRRDVERVVEAGDVVTFGNLPRLTVRTDVREVRTTSGRRAGVIAFNFWMTSIDAPVAAAVDRFRAADGLVIDLRGNTGGLAAMMSGISGHIIADPDVLLGRMQTRQAQLEFHPNPRTSTPEGRSVEPFRGPVAVLVDELTGSTSECFAGALQGLGRARVFGRQTMGEALPALTKRLENGDVLMYAVGNFVTGSGRSLEGDGVIPDEVVPLSSKALVDGHDEPLEAALAWIERGRPASGR